MTKAVSILKRAEAGGTGNTDAEKEALFHRAFARAFAHWTFVEHELFVIFAALLRSERGGGDFVVFNAFSGFRQKLEATTELSNLVLGAQPDLRKKWKALAKGANNAAKLKRNKLAHYRPIYKPRGPQGDLTPFMEPGDRLSFTVTGTDADPMDEHIIKTNQIVDWGYDFLNLADQFLEFRNQLFSAKLVKFSGSPRPSPYKSSLRPASPKSNHDPAKPIPTEPPAQLGASPPKSKPQKLSSAQKRALREKGSQEG